MTPTRIQVLKMLTVINFTQEQIGPDQSSFRLPRLRGGRLIWDRRPTPKIEFALSNMSKNRCHVNAVNLSRTASR